MRKVPHRIKKQKLILYKEKSMYKERFFFVLASPLGKISSVTLFGFEYVYPYYMYKE